MIRRVRQGLAVAAVFVPLGVAQAPAETIYICKRKDGVPLYTNIPTECGYPREIRRWGEERTPGKAPGLDELIRSVALRHGVEPELVRAVIKVESDFDARARSRKGAQGLMQLMPETARLHNVIDAYDPGENVEGGVRHLRLLLDTYGGDLQLALAAYNAGIQAVERYGGIPPFPETRHYVRRVLSYYQRFRGFHGAALRP
jgi:soluble lytic murein transglycosylase-like protein